MSEKPKTPLTDKDATAEMVTKALNDAYGKWRLEAVEGDWVFFTTRPLSNKSGG